MDNYFAPLSPLHIHDDKCWRDNYECAEHRVLLLERALSDARAVLRKIGSYVDKADVDIDKSLHK